jgi:predicted ATPase/class 3 adenylate cyclase
MDVVVWLRSLGLGKYEAAFRENEIDETVLPNLTAEDLKELGVTALGHRRKLLAAIATLREDASDKTPSVDVATTSSTPSPHPEDRAERRQVTVMFCDLVGSTALSGRMDPEDLREVISAYQKCVAETVQRFAGFVAKYMGDGVLIYFGYPQAHEDDAERAVRAGLEVVAAVGALKTHAPLQTRLGIATGLVVVGDLIGSGASQEQAIVGETPNLAARLQGLAEPNNVVIAESTRKLVGNLFELHDLGAQDLKGISGPVRTWAALRPASVESRFEALHATGVTELVGRDEEIELLLRRWSKAKTGEGQVVLLSGEPGIGKSRLTASFMERLGTEPRMRLRYFCSPQHTDSALYPIISQMERAAGFAHDDTAQAKLDKLDVLLAQSFTPRQDAALLAEMLSLPNNGRYPTLELAPQQRRQKTLEALTAQLVALSGTNPVLMIFEDVHWIDPTTLEALERTVDRLKTLGVLLIITYRPEFEPPWIGRPYVNAITLNRLGEREIAAIIDGVRGNKLLPVSIRQDIIERTDGVPLFVEEMTKAVLEAESEGDALKTTAAVPSSGVSVPASLHASLMARLDRLGPAKKVAQIGAVIGREFPYELLGIVARRDEANLRAALDRLSEARLVFRRGTPPDAIYTFKHALVQDAAYSTLLRGDRQELHAHVAEALEERFPEWIARQPELLAHHFAEARQTERAIGYWLKAGERAASRSANLEAVRQLTRGLEMLQTLPESPERDRRELAFQIAIGTPLIAVRGYSAPETGAAYSRARVLCERLGEAEPLVATLSGEFVFHFVRGNYPMMRRLTDEARQVSERFPNPIVRLASHRLAGITAMHFGAFFEARSEFEAILRLYDESRHRSEPVHYVHDPKVSALTYLALVLWVLGLPEQARRSSVAAFQCAAELDQANLTAHVRNFAGAGLAELLGDVAAVRAHADAMIELAERHSLGYWRVNALILRGWALAQEGAAEAGLELMCRNAADRTAQGVGWYQARYLCMLAAVYAQIGQAEAGLRVIAEAKDLVARNDEHMWESELDRVEGELRRMQGASASDVEACFARAVARSHQQCATSLELRAGTSLARLWRDHGKRSEARDLLGPVYGRFTEGFDTRDLKEAKALLEELAS